MSTLFEQIIEESSDTITIPMELNNGTKFEFKLVTPAKISLKQKQIDNMAKSYVQRATIAANPKVETPEAVEFREFAEKAGFTPETIGELRDINFWQTAVLLHFALVEPQFTVYETALLAIRRFDVVKTITDALEANSQDGTVYYDKLKND